MAHKSQKAQNDINALAKRVKDAEKAKEELAKEHKESQTEYQEENNEEVDDKVFTLEKRLNQMHKETLDLKKKKERLEVESARISAKIKILHENEHPCLAMLIDYLGSIERGTAEGKINNAVIEALASNGSNPEMYFEADADRLRV